MEHLEVASEEREQSVDEADEHRAREREALRRRVRESLLRCPGAELSQN